MQRGRSAMAVGLLGLLVVAALLAYAWITLDPLITELTGIEKSRFPRLQLLLEARQADTDASLALRNLLLFKDSGLNDAEVARYESSAASAARALQTVASQLRRPEEIALAREALAARAALEQTRREAVALDASSPDPAAVDAMTTQLQRTLDAYLASLRRLQDFGENRIRVLVEDMGNQANTLKLLLLAAGCTAGLSMLAMAAVWRAEVRRELARRDRSIQELREQRNALVREVHHRIKNHLQGLLALFDASRATAAAAGVPVTPQALQGHVLALVGVHGLQARSVDEAVSFRDLVRQQVELVRAGTPEAHVAVVEDGELPRARLHADSAVPLALIVTELIVNAIKHGDGAPVHVVLAQREGVPTVSITNRVREPVAMSWAQRRGFGTGLSLAASLAEGIARVRQSSDPSGDGTSLKITVELEPGAWA